MIEAYQSDSEISFKVHNSILQQVEEWERAIDERIFFEQLRTGRLVYDDYDIHPDSFELMKKRYKKHGKIEPYYGCSGCSPSFQFQILPERSHLKLTVKHGAIDDTLGFASLLLSKGMGTLAARNFRITGKKLETLSTWEEWNAAAALSDRYIFHFFSCSIGAGCSVKHAETGNEINVTDYDDLVRPS